MRGSKTPDPKRAEAVGLALVKGVPAAAKATGFSQRNIRRWKEDPELSELVLSAKEELLHTMRAAIWVGMDQINAGLISADEPLKDKASTVFGLMDRHQLMSGEATSRTETRTWTADLDPDQQRKLRDWAFDRLDELSGRTADDEGAAEGAGVREPAAG